MLVFLLVFVLPLVLVYFFLQTPPFGTAPDAGSLEKIRRSAHFPKGSFQNREPTPALTEGAGFFKVMGDFFFRGSRHKRPSAPLPSMKTDLISLDPRENILVWYGHSSYFFQTEGRKFLVDPVFSRNASPLSFTTKSFTGTDIAHPENFPFLDFLFLTHDHWDHLDYQTLLALKPKIGKIFTGLGTGAHLRSWGFENDRIHEMDWDETMVTDDGFQITAVTARHFSGRGLKRNGTLWVSFVLETPARKIFIGGDSGYGTHFAAIGRRFGPFDLAVLEDGQYDPNWKYIHMSPEETIQAAIDLQAKKMLPVHWARFSLSAHAWNEPILRLLKEAGLKNVKVLHPQIGEKVNLDADQAFSSWWEGIV